MITRLGKWTNAHLDIMIHEASAITDIGERFDYISRQFLNTPYSASTLTGSANIQEVLVINLEGMDCMTFIEYVEAMHLSSSYAAFIENLKRVRYRNGAVSYKDRRHFFTDWAACSPRIVEDITTIIGGTTTVKIKKKLNSSRNGKLILDGIPTLYRDISYIPSNALDDKILERLKTGDFIGIYSSKDGLDVTHTGIIIKKDAAQISIRHASSRKNTGMVTDEDLGRYLSGKPGIIIMRNTANCRL